MPIISLMLGTKYHLKIDGKIDSNYDSHANFLEDLSFNIRKRDLEKIGCKVEIVEFDNSWGTWIEWNDFFRVRGYKKGTMHFEFIDENVWALFNQKVAEIRGWKVIAKAKNKKSK